jgi:hypothetical protein
LIFYLPALEGFFFYQSLSRLFREKKNLKEETLEEARIELMCLRSVPTDHGLPDQICCLFLKIIDLPLGVSVLRQVFLCPHDGFCAGGNGLSALLPRIPLRFTRGYKDVAPTELLMHDFGFIRHPTSDNQHQPVSVLRQVFLCTHDGFCAGGQGLSALLPRIPLRFTRGYKDSAPTELLMHDFGFIKHPTSDIRHQPLSVLRQVFLCPHDGSCAGGNGLGLSDARGSAALHPCLPAVVGLQRFRSYGAAYILVHDFNLGLWRTQIPFRIGAGADVDLSAAGGSGPASGQVRLGLSV